MSNPEACVDGGENDAAGEIDEQLNEELLRAGLAFAYDDRRKFHYNEAMYRRLKAAQRKAQEEERGFIRSDRQLVTKPQLGNVI